MYIKGNLKVCFESKLNSIGYLKKYDFDDMDYSIMEVKDIDNLFKFLISKEISLNEIEALKEILLYYIRRDYNKGSSMRRAGKLFTNFLEYKPKIEVLEKVIDSNQEIYDYILNNKESFEHLKGYNSFNDILFTAFKKVNFRRRGRVPKEIRFLYEGISNTLLLPYSEVNKIIKEYKETNDIKYRNLLLEHYQRFILERVINYHTKYGIKYEVLFDLGNKVVFDTIERYSLDSNISLDSKIRNRFFNYVEYLVLTKNRKYKQEYVIKKDTKDEMEVMLDRLEQILDWDSLKELILSINFTDKEVYTLLYGYGLFGFTRKSFSKIANDLGVSKEYINKEVKNRLIKKIRKAIILKSLEDKEKRLTEEELKLIKDYPVSFMTMQANSFKMFFKRELQENDINLVDLENEVLNIIKEDKKANYILKKRYGKDNYQDDVFVMEILEYVDKYVPLTILEYYYLFNKIIPSLKESLNKSPVLTLDLQRHSC